MLEDGVYAYAASITEIAALIGEPAGLRFTKMVVPQRSGFPASVMQRTGTVRDQTYCGTVRLLQATLQFDHYAKKWDEAVATAEVFRLAFTDFAGMMGGVEVRSVVLQNEFDLDDPEPGLYRRSQSWLFWYVE
jgi:hypothetical protein